MRTAHLFAGAGGSLLAGDLLGWQHVVAAELDPFCRAVLAERWGVSLIGDVGTEPWERYACRVDLLAGGWPCQPVSSAGKRLASADHRDGWPLLVRALRLCRPRYFFGENVAAILTAESGRYWGRCLADLAALGYDARWTVLRASDAGAPHRRERLWVFGWRVADAGSFGCERRADLGGRGRGEAERCEEGRHAGNRGLQFLAHPGGSGRLPAERHLRPGQPDSPGGDTLADPGRGGEQRRREPGDLGGETPGARGEGYQRERRRDAARDGRPPALADPDLLRCDRGPVSGGEGAGEPAGLAGAEGDHEGTPESPLGRGADGLAAGLPWPGASGVWPAGRGQEQAAWEPARTCGRTPLRRQQLKALGNGWVPAQAVLAWRLLTGRYLGR